MLSATISTVGAYDGVIESQPQIICDNEEKRTVVAEEGNNFYVGCYNKQEEELVLQVFQGQYLVDTITIDLKKPIEQSTMTFRATADVVQSETGYGYLQEDEISHYACAYALVSNGTYSNQGIRMNNSTLADAQRRFRNNVDKMIASEEKLQELTDKAGFWSIITVLAACAGQSIIATTTALKALDISLDAEVESEVLAAYDKNCESFFSMMYPYRLN